MPSELDTTNWSGEGTFTQVVIDRLRTIDAIGLVRVEDAPASRSEADYNFISNEIFVAFTTVARTVSAKRFGFLPSTRTVSEKTMNVVDLERLLTTFEDIGSPDYSDD